MADSVNRIVPLSISRDRLAPLGKEKNDRDDFQRRKHEEKNHSVQPLLKEIEEDRRQVIGESEKKRTKGKNLDLSV